tara:strand:- start:91 stop:294 length:204 start_codon:yes stop_codon:yes gene_type:complete
MPPPYPGHYWIPKEEPSDLVAGVSYVFVLAFPRYPLAAEGSLQKSMAASWHCHHFPILPFFLSDGVF